MSWKQTIALDEGVYSLSVAQRVAYALAGDLTIQIKQNGARLELDVTPTVIAGPGTLVPSIAHAHERVLRHLNDFALRDQIHRETWKLREALVSAALRGAGV
ncbi:hypothetical protein PS3A_07540 [Pseudomonas sp. 3A(2025)]